MKYQKPAPLSKFHPFAYFALAIYIGIFFLSAWFASNQHKVALQMREEFEHRRDQLHNEINRLKIQETKLTSIERIHEIAEDLQMVQPSKQAYVLRAD
jgi:cell division protein FtsL